MNFDFVFIISFSNYGKELEDKLLKMFSQKVELNFFVKTENESSNDFVKKAFDFAHFSKKVLIIFIGALGICVRKINPFIQSKITDPAVLCIDDCSKFVIPVLSGHLGGANETAHHIAQKLGAIPIITTSTDIHHKFAIDVWCKKHNFDLQNKNIESISKFICDINSSSLKNEKIFYIGVGCKKNTSNEKMISFIKNTLLENEIPIELVKSIASIDVKKDEEAIKNLSNVLNTELHFYTCDELKTCESLIDGNVEFSKSNFVQQTVGIDCVCERSAFLSSKYKILLIKKIAIDGMTLAIAL